MTPSVEQRTLRRISWRIVPFICLLYFIAFIDRVNIRFAALTMNEDVGLSPAAFGFGAGIFFLGYFLFEVPSNLVSAVVTLLLARRASREGAAQRADRPAAAVAKQVVQLSIGRGEHDA